MSSIPDSSLSVQFNDKIRRIEIDNVCYFSVLDIFKHYSTTSNATQSWQGVETFLIKQGAIDSDWAISGAMESIELRMHKFEGKGQRATPIGSFEMLMRIGQVTTFKEWEPMRSWMAVLAKERYEEQLHPELGIYRAQSRFLDAKMAQGMSADEAVAFLKEVQEGRIIRRQWMDALKAAMRYALEGWQYGQVTNTEYRTIYGMDAKEISQATGFKVARDGMTKLGRSILHSAEIALEAEFDTYENLTFQHALVIVKDVCLDFQFPVQRIEKRLGISLATGKPLLGDGR